MDKYQLTNAVEMLEQFPCGHMLYDQMSRDGVNWETAFFIKDEQRKIKRLGHLPIIEVRTGLINVDGIPVVDLMVGGRGQKMIYEAFFNYYLPAGASPYFADLASQETLSFIFMNERNDIVRIVEDANSVKRTFQEFSETISKRPPWSMEAFDQAKLKFMDQYPGLELWHKFFRR